MRRRRNAFLPRKSICTAVLYKNYTKTHLLGLTGIMVLPRVADIVPIYGSRSAP